ncbi:PucR family transcriptional regulator [Senegalia massiliensis]|uniref:PucR family transcriptional regulator n=1 Tax=Senegalia massiliensis TaxID=1720316 RepID=A0A845QY19_9CLOT|nr:PucR family transcriptional regulator [Senegalia massiliensis]NBI05283.1 PucR family transcriptional regulator [Senegalia massiliensis]
MDFNVKKLLSLEAYKRAKLISGKEGINNIITGITIMEDVTIHEWLKGGEALVTSLLPIKDYKDKEIFDFFDTLLNKDLSAVIIKIKKAVTEVPQGLIEWGDKRNIPIIEVPRNVFYTDLMYPVMAEVMESKVNKLNYFKKVHYKFTDMAIKNCSIEDVIKELSIITNNPIELYDKNNNLILTTFEKNLKRDKQQFKKLKYSEKYYYIERETYENENFSQLIIEINSINNTKAYLGVLEINEKINEMDMIAIENAATNIALAMTKDIAIQEVEERFMSDIIHDLIFRTPGFNKDLLKRANIAGIDLFSKYYVIVLNFDCDLKNIKERFKKEISKLVKKHNGVYAIRNKDVIILFDISNENFKKSIGNLKEDIKILRNDLEKEDCKNCFIVGVGNEVEGYKNLKDSYNDAINAIKIGKDLKNKNEIFIYDELGIFKLLKNMSSMENINQYIPNSILKIIKIDEEKNKELLNTLEAYIESNMKVTQAANKLFVHPKTVSYRLEQIKELTDIDFDDSNKVLELHLALKMIKFRDKFN